MKKIVSVLLCAVMLLPVLQTSAGAVSTSAVSSCLIEAETGEVLFAENAEERRAMASTTKIMTAILTIEAGELDREFTVDEFAIMVEGTSMGLQGFAARFAVRDTPAFGQRRGERRRCFGFGEYSGFCCAYE